MYAVPAASSAAFGREPGPIVVTSARAAVDAVSRTSRVAAAGTNRFMAPFLPTLYRFAVGVNSAAITSEASPRAASARRAAWRVGAQARLRRTRGIAES